MHAKGTLDDCVLACMCYQSCSYTQGRFMATESRQLHTTIALDGFEASSIPITKWLSPPVGRIKMNVDVGIDGLVGCFSEIVS